MYETTITIFGRLVAEPEVKQTPKGQVTNLRVAVNERRREPDGNWTDGPSSYFSVSAWGELGVEVAQCLHTGNAVLVAGTLRVHSYTVDGLRRERVEVKADHIGPDLRFGTALYRPRSRGGRGNDNSRSMASGDAPWAGQGSPESPEELGEYTGSYEVVDDSEQRADATEAERIVA